MKRYIRSNESNEFEYEYRLLDRLRSDCDYVLRTMDYGSSFDSAQKHFWAKNWQDQIAKMREIYSVLPEKPEWLSEEDIDLYENKFRVADSFEPVEPMSEAQTWSVRPGEQPSRLIESSRKPALKGRAIKANLYGDAYEDIEISRDAYIQQWQDEYEGEPSTSWDDIFDKVLDDFVLYCGDEASADETGKTIEEKYESGEYTSVDVEDEFDNWIMWISLDDYDY
jgi:hypothetical protein